MVDKAMLLEADPDGLGLSRKRRSRAGFVQTTFDVTVSRSLVYQVPTGNFQPAARYSAIPVLLIVASGIVAVDSPTHRAW